MFVVESFPFQFAVQIHKDQTHVNAIFPVVLHGREVWCLTLREEHRLMLSENRVLRKISGPERDEVTGE